MEVIFLNLASIKLQFEQVLHARALYICAYIIFFNEPLSANKSFQSIQSINSIGAVFKQKALENLWRPHILTNMRIYHTKSYTKVLLHIKVLQKHIFCEWCMAWVIHHTKVCCWNINKTCMLVVVYSCLTIYSHTNHSSLRVVNE